MRWDIIKGNWQTFKVEIRENSRKLTDDDMAVINGQRSQLIVVLQKRYGISKGDAEREVVDFENTSAI